MCVANFGVISLFSTELLPPPPSAALKSVSLDEVPPQIRQMLLVLQGIHRTPPSEDYFTLVTLLPHVVKPYQCLVPRIRNQNEAECKLFVNDFSCILLYKHTHTHTHAHAHTHTQRGDYQGQRQCRDETVPPSYAASPQPSAATATP